MAELFTLENLLTLFMLVMLQAVLGFDNLLYISLESKRAPVADQSRVRTLGIGIAVVLRIVLLILLLKLISLFQDPVISFDNQLIHGTFNIHSFIVLGGGAFILYTAVKEIFHMLAPYDLEHGEDKEPSSAGKIITLIVLMNLIFSFDSILSAMALAKKDGETTIGTDGVIIMTVAILIGGFLMIWLADRVATFLEKNRMYEVLGLFVLFLVGIMLLTEGAHLAHLKLFGHEIQQMTKATFYFVIAVLVVVDVVQGRYQKKLLAKHSKGKGTAPA